MHDKPPKEDGRSMWERVLSSIPHGLKVRTISVRGTGEGKEKVLSNPMEQPSEAATPCPVGEE